MGRSYLTSISIELDGNSKMKKSKSKWLCAGTYVRPSIQISSAQLQRIRTIWLSSSKSSLDERVGSLNSQSHYVDDAISCASRVAVLDGLVLWGGDSVGKFTCSCYTYQ